MIEPTTVDDEVTASLRRHWEDGWNRGDVATIMAPFAEGVVFSSPFVAKLTGDPDRTEIVGAAALRDYVADSLRRAPGIGYTVEAVHAGAGSVVLVYTVHRPDGSTKHGADYLRLDAGGRIVEWRCHYTADFLGAGNRYLVDDAAG